MIIVTGTPGSGKTTFSKYLAKELNYKYLDVNNFIKKNALCEALDEDKDCMVVDEHKLAEKLTTYAKDKKIIIDSHMSYFIDPKYVELAICMKANIETLNARLKERGYSKQKIQENLECEIFDICCEEAKEIGHKLFIINTSDNPDYSMIIKRIKELLQ